MSNSQPKRDADNQTLLSVLSVPNWPDPAPIPDELRPVDQFDKTLLPEILRPWIDDIAERMQCPADFPAVASIIALAGIVGRKIGIRPKQRDAWQVTPNLWGVVIGRPGMMKSHAIMEPLNVLKRFEVEAKKSYKKAMRDHQAVAMVAAAKKRAGHSALLKAVKDGEGDLDKIAEEIVTEDGGADEEPVRHRYLLNDSTVEKLGEILNQNPNGVTVYRDELVGLLKSLDKDGQDSSRAFYLEAWNGDGRHTVDRIGRGTIDIESTTVSIIGGVTPGPLSEYLRTAVEGGLGDDGLMQRFQLAVWPDSPNSWRNVDRWPDTEAKTAAFEMYQRLKSLDPADVGAESDSNEEIPFLRFNADAQGQFNDWRAGLEHRLLAEDDHPAISSHLAKYRSLIPSLALLFHLSDPPAAGEGVSSRSVEMAIHWGRYLESHARRIYGHAISGKVTAAKAVARKIRDGSLQDGFVLREVYRPGWSQLTSRDNAAAAVEMLTDLDWLQEERLPTGGRDRTRYRIHPGILSDCGQDELTKLTKETSTPSSGGEISDVGLDAANALLAEATEDEAGETDF